MKKVVRHFARTSKKIDDAKLRRLWPLHITEAAIAEEMGHTRWTLRRRAIKIGLPSSRREIWDGQR